MLSFGEKGQDAGSEFVGALDLRHVTNARKQTCLCMWNESTGRIEVMCGQDAIAVTPQNQGGPGVKRGRGGQLGSPKGLDAASGAQVAGDLERNDAGVGLAGDGQRVFNPLLARQGSVSVQEAFGEQSAAARGTSSHELTEGRNCHQPQRDRDLGAEARAVAQHQACHAVCIEPQQLQRHRATERVADHVPRTPLAQNVEGVERSAREHL
jgi:hypothetical protein